MKINREGNIILIYKNQFLDIIYSDIDISDDYINFEDIEILFNGEKDGLYSLNISDICYDKGQEGDFGRWEIKPYYYFEKHEIKRISRIDKKYITISEYKNKRKEKREKTVKKLRDWVCSFSNNEIKYDLCKIWSCESKVTLRTVTGEGFRVYKDIHSFDESIKLSNLLRIKLWIYKYFKNQDINKDK